ncbi:MAG: nitrate- and nitrite sensing domain-containing protein [Rhodocyclaceae bacterium]|nr:nitrate- and nitrite sensing domain-containing protein [Rhodocyclaceae bacterium]
MYYFPEPISIFAMTLRLRLVLLATISVLCMFAATWQWLGRVQHESHIARLQDAHNHWAHACSTLIHFLQQERGYSASALANQQYDRALLQGYRKDADAALANVLSHSLSTSGHLLRSSLADLSQSLSGVRTQFGNDHADWRDVRDGYTAIIARLLGVIQFELGSRTEYGFIDSQRTLHSIAELAMAREALGLIRATVNVIKHEDAEATRSDLSFVTSQYALYRNHQNNFDQIADSAMRGEMQAVRSDAVYQWVISLIEALVVSAERTRTLDPDDAWWTQASTVIDVQKTIEDKAYADLEGLT